MNIQISTTLFHKVGFGSMIRAVVNAPNKWCDKYELVIPVMVSSFGNLHDVTAGRFVAKQFAKMLQLVGTWTVTPGGLDGVWVFTCGAEPEVAFTIK